MLAEMSVGEILDVAQTVVMVGITVFGAMWRMAMGRVTDRVGRTEQRLDAHQQKIEQISEAIRSGVSKEDFIRETSRTRQDLVQLIEGQARLEGRMDIGTRVAATLERVAGGMAAGKAKDNG